ncbi:MAG TPA: hypothetical protein VJR05_08885 [Acidimicrobiia bacterium]|nr:hypothetical protein [Acidimicrobiia bacterium]
MELTDATRQTAGVLLIAITFVEYGGTFLLRVVGGGNAFTPFQKAFFRAGHAHAGVLVILSLLALLYADTLALGGFGRFGARSAIPLAAILMPAGFFFSALGRGRERANRLIVLVYLGAASLAIGVVTLGLALLGGV